MLLLLATAAASLRIDRHLIITAQPHSPDMFALLALGLVVLAALGADNYYALTCPHDGRKSMDILGIDNAASCTLSHVRSLASLADAVQLFHALGASCVTGDDKDHLPQPLQGEFYAETLLLGRARYAGGYLITQYGMGLCSPGGDEVSFVSILLNRIGLPRCDPRVEAAGMVHLGPWVGKWFSPGVPVGDGEGGNLFGERGGLLVRGRPFRVVRHVTSALDALPSTQLNYSTTDLLPLRNMVDEVRCINSDLCLGFGGFAALGLPVSGVPFIMYRRAVSPSDTVAAAAAVAAEGSGDAASVILPSWRAEEL